MKKILIKQATIVDFNSPFHLQKKDILFEDGRIKNIADRIDGNADLIYEWKNAYVSNGWIDLQANFCDPGFEAKESLLSGLAAAANGGFTAVCPSPNTNPPISNKTQIEYLNNKSKSFVGKFPKLLPVGTITQNSEGNDIAEMFDMMQAGAIAFSDYKRSIKDPSLLQRILLYAKNIDARLFLHCNDQSLSSGGLMHEGEVSTRIGVKGMPALAEEIDLERTISILQYTEGKCHINTISTAKSVDLIRIAKANGLNITCGVSIPNLLFTEADVFSFDSFYKVNPPLRSVNDQMALHQGLLEGTIDVIVSDHNPHDIEAKDVEFDFAEFGMSTIETFLPMLVASKIGLPIETLVQKMYVRPSEILGLDLESINVGADVNATLFSFEETWAYNNVQRKTKGVNSVFIDKQLFGKAIAIL